MIKLIASDVDGTLIREGMLHVNPRLFDIIRELKKHNITFVAASGRPYNNLVKVFEPVRDYIAYISESGSIGMFHNEMFYDHPLDRPAVVEMVHDIRSRKDGNILFSQVDSTYLETELNSPYYHYMHDQLLYNFKLVPDLLAMGNPCYKVASCNLCGNQEDAVFYKNKYGDDYTVVTSGDYWVDIIPKGIDKGTCLSALLDKLNISPNECMAFGDQENDIAMLKLAGTSYAMDTSLPQVVESATHQISCVEDVLEDFLKTL